MTDDEAFIRAFVDHPADETARLVYADWLDDRDAPRGAYLRAESEAIETGDVERLRKLAVGLDPVWVARVSMPPVGVCIEGAEITERGSTVSAADIGATENRLGITFPPDYRAFLLNYNGGLLRRVWGEVDGETIYVNAELRLYPLLPAPAGGDRDTLDGEAARHRQWATDPRVYETRVVDPLVAEMALRYTRVGWSRMDWVLIGVRQPNFGRVGLFHDDNELSARFLATEGRRECGSFAEFLAQFLWPPAPIVPVDNDLPF